MSLKIHYGIYQSQQAYCYLSQTGSVYSWGNNSYGGNSLHLAKDISKNIVKIIASERGFCALRNDGKVFSWGYGGEYLNYNIDEENSDYIDIFHGWTSYFAGLKKMVGYTYGVKKYSIPGIVNGFLKEIKLLKLNIIPTVLLDSGKMVH